MLNVTSPQSTRRAFSGLQRLAARHLAALTIISLVFKALAVHASTSETTWGDVIAANTELALWQTTASYAHSCDKAAFQRAFKEVSTWPERRARAAEQILMRAWTERDPDAAITYREAHKATLSWEAHNAFYGLLVEKNRAKALSVLNNEAPERRESFDYLVAHLLAERDPAAALAIVLSPSFANHQTAIRVIVVWSEQNPAQALPAALSIPDPAMRLRAAQIAFLAWFQNEPSAALAWVKRSVLTTADRANIVTGQVAGVGIDNIDTLLRLAAEETDPDLKNLLKEALSRAWMFQAPENAWTQIAKNGWEGMPPDLLFQLLGHTDQKLPAEALAFFQSIPRTHLKDRHVIHSLARRWTRLDAAAALRWASDLPEGELQGEALLGVNQVLSIVDPEMAAAQAEAMPAGEWRRYAITTTAAGYARRSPVEALEWAACLADEAERKDALDRIARFGADHDPVAMASAATGLKDFAARTFLTERLAREWLEQDVTSASQWFLSLPATPGGTSLRREILSEWVSHAPETVVRQVEAMPDSRERVNLLRALAASGMSQQPEAVVALVDRLPAGKDRYMLWQDAVSTLTQSNPRLAAELAVTNTLSKEHPGNSINSVALEWARSAPEDAARWLDTLGTHPATGKPFGVERGNVAWNWARADPERALSWVEKIPDAQTKSEVREHVAGALSSCYPAQAFQLAAANGANERVLGIRARDLFSHFPEQAEALIRQSSLPEATKTKLLGAKTP